MRTQFKFRVWDIFKEQMHPVSGIHFGSDGSGLTITVEAAPIGEFYKPLVHGESGVLMQFTGLKDKNGREIYEGDILDLSDGPAVVVWRSGGWQCDFSDGGNIGIDEACVWFGNNAFVIGNTYENPELVK